MSEQVLTGEDDGYGREVSGRGLAHLVLACCLVLACSPSDPPADKLLHFDAPERIHGRFLVQFKSDRELERIGTDRDQSPDTIDKVKKITRELAQAVGGHVVDILGRTGGAKTGYTFVIEMADEQAIQLAKDRRILLIEPDRVVHRD